MTRTWYIADSRKVVTCKNEFETLVNVISEYYHILMFRPYMKTFDICSWFVSFLLLSLCPCASDLVTAKSNSWFRVRYAVLFPLYCAAMQLKKKTSLLFFFIRKRIRVFRVNNVQTCFLNYPKVGHFRDFWSDCFKLSGGLNFGKWKWNIQR